MTATIQTKPFLEALEAAGIAAGRSLPALTCALVECEKGKVSVTCDNMDARIIATVDGAEVDKPFSFLTGVRLLRAALRGETAEITLQKDKLTIKSGGVTTLNTVPVKEFPQQWPDVPRHSVDPVELLTAIKACAACAGNDQTVKDCIYWDRTTARMVSTDGKMVQAMPMAFLMDDSFMLPAVQAKLILSCFSVDDTLSAGAVGSTFCVSSEGRRAYFRMREGNYFNYAVVVPKSAPFAIVNRDGLLSVLKSLAPFTDEWQRVKIQPGKNEWTLSTGCKGNESTATLAVQTVGEADEFTASIHWLPGIIQHWACDEVAVTLGGALLIHPVGNPGQFGVNILFRS